MNVKIYTMTHKSFRRPNDPVYIPLHVGRELSQDLGYIGDNTGDNISCQNPYYGELTGLYWIWKNETEADIIGICHYRRFFMNEDGSFMGRGDYEAVLADYDVMVSELVSSDVTSRENYSRAHNGHDMEAVGEAIKKLYPEDYGAFCRVMEGHKGCYGNLMAAKKEIFDAYCEWLFNILTEASKDIEIESRDIYHQRVYGFISEILLYVWVVARGLRIKEGKIGITAEKAETVEFKLAMGQLIAAGDIAQAKELFYGFLKLRPDIRLELSDIKKEIPAIELLIYIMHEEQRADVEGLLAFSRKLPVLMQHYEFSKKLLMQYGRENVRTAGADYFKEFPISDVALDILEKDIRGEVSFYEYLNEGKPAKKVSVIVLVCNGEKSFGGCIGNLVHQTLKEIEIIFIDDGSTDNSRSVLYECQRQYPDKVRVIASSDKHGMGNAGNRGLDAATGEYIGFVNCSDLPDVMMYEKLYTKAKEGNYDMVDGGMIDMSADGEKRRRLPAGNDYLWNRLIRREIIENHHLRFDEKDGMADDVEFLNALSANVHTVGNVKDVVYRHGQHS